MKKEELPFLTQLIESLDESAKNLEKAINQNETENQKKLNLLILNLQEKISEILK